MNAQGQGRQFRDLVRLHGVDRIERRGRLLQVPGARMGRTCGMTGSGWRRGRFRG